MSDEGTAKVSGDQNNPVSKRALSLRVRLIVLMLSVAAVALVAVDVMLPMYMRSALLSDLDAGLQRASAAVPASLNTASENILPADIGVTIVYPNGSARVWRSSVSDPGANPRLPSNMVTGKLINSTDPDAGAEYRMLASDLTVIEGGQQIRGYYAVVWAPLSTVTSPVNRVILAELVITAGLLALLGILASVIIRRELKPLEDMVTAADQITNGNLSRRVSPDNAGTEVGRLATGFNRMLDGIGELLTERELSELRMRQFLADASHELRTPVAAVRGYTDLYQAGALSDESSVDRAMERMGFEADRMGALVGDLLTLIQADAEPIDQYTTVDLTELLNGVTDDAVAIDPTREWRLVGTERLGSVTVNGDRLRLHQVFANLLSNVRTYTDPGTITTIALDVLPNQTTVTVADNGAGVPDAALPKLFDRFYRADPSRSRAKGGTGLGLSIVAAIVRRHRGCVIASHTPGGGLTITVTLPLASAGVLHDHAVPGSS